MVTKERDKLKDTSKNSMALFDRERKMLNQRLHELSITYRSHQKLKGSLKQLIKMLAHVKEEHMKIVG